MAKHLRLAAVVTAALGVVGAFVLASYSYQIAHLQRSAHEELSGIAHLKVEDVERWRAARRADAELLRTTPTLVEYGSTRSAPSRQHLETVLAWMIQHYSSVGYRSIDVLDPDEDPPAWEGVPDLVARVRAEGPTLLSSVFREAGEIGGW